MSQALPHPKQPPPLHAQPASQQPPTATFDPVPLLPRAERQSSLPTVFLSNKGELPNMKAGCWSCCATEVSCNGPVGSRPREPYPPPAPFCSFREGLCKVWTGEPLPGSGSVISGCFEHTGLIHCMISHNDSSKQHYGSFRALCFESKEHQQVSEEQSASSTQLEARQEPLHWAGTCAAQARHEH